MLVLKRLALTAFVLGFMIAIGVVVKAHDGLVGPDPKIPHLDFVGEPSITCNIDGKWFHHNRVVDGHGNVITDFWYEEPRDPIFRIEGGAHGFGWAHIKLSGNINGEKFGDADDFSKSEQVGFWIGISPHPVFEGNDSLVHEEYGAFDRDEGEYTWKANGTIELVPYIWKWRLGGRAVGGEWIPAPDHFHKSADPEAGGKWTVKHHYSSVVSIDYNKTVFNVYETLEVTVKKPDLYYAVMYIDGVHAASGYAGNDGEIVLSKTFNTGDVGNHTVKIIAYFDGGANSTTNSSTITVK